MLINVGPTVLSLDEDFALTLINIDRPWLKLINLKLAYGVDSDLPRWS